MDNLKDMVWCMVYALEWSKTESTSTASMNADRAISGMRTPLHHRNAARMREAEEMGRKMHEEHLRVYAEGQAARAVDKVPE